MTAIAQKGTQSPYSSLGLGELNSEGYALFAAMGGVALANSDSSIVNSFNPASYSFLARNMPVFQVGLNGKASQFSTESGSTNQRHFGLNQFQLGLPVKKNWGIGIGIKPYTFTGYTVTKYGVSEGDTSTVQIAEGSGGLRIANFGLAYKPLNYSKFIDDYKIHVPSKDTTSESKRDTLYLKGTRFQYLSFGASANYLFGTSSHLRSQEFIPSTATTFNARVVEGLRVSGASFEVGLNYQVGFRSKEIERTFALGATYSPAQNVRAYQDLYSYSYVGSFYRGESVIVVDTVEFVNNDQGSLYKPESYGVGLQYVLRPYKSSSVLRVAADLKMERWSTFYTEFSGIQNNAGLKDRLSAGVGLEFTPKSGVYAFDNNVTFLQRLHYRIGFNYTQTELLIQNNLDQDIAIDNYGMSFGLGIPILVGNSNTNINFGASLGNLGTTANGIIQERYVGMYVGLSITPLGGNAWFVKRKYN